MPSSLVLLVAATIVALASTVVSAQVPSKVMMDVFTNSHCGPCATMHANVDAVITNTARKQNVVLVYHHIRVYADDPIYQANTVDPTQRAQFMRGVAGTPTVFFNGQRWTSSYAGWAAHLDALLAQTSNIDVQAEAEFDEAYVTLTYTITSVDPAAQASNLYAAVVENVTYRGRNNVSSHDGANRAGLTPAEGVALEFDELGVAKGTARVLRRAGWDMSKLRVVLSVQNPETREQLQVEEVLVTPADENPTSVQEELELDNATVVVVGIDGRVIFQGTANTSQLASLVPHDAPTGVYLARVTTGTAQRTVPIIHTR